MKLAERVPALAWRIGYVAVVLAATVLDAGLDPELADFAANLARAFEPSFTGRTLVDAVRNVALFAGWGVVWMVTARSIGMRAAVAATLTGIVLSAAVEGIQLYSFRRTASVLDVGTNTLGALLGALVTLVVAMTVRERRTARSYVGVPMLLFAIGYGGAVLLEAALPLMRQEILSGALGGPFERLQHALLLLDEGSWRVFSTLDLLLFAPAGFFVVAAFAEHRRGYRSAAIIVTVAGALAMFAAEFARGLVGYRLAWGPPITHALAISAGAWLTARVLPAATRNLRGADRPLALHLSYIFLLLCWGWRPLVFHADLEGFRADIAPERFVPLLDWRDRVDLFTAADALVPALLFLPLGCLLAVWPLRRTGPARDLWPAIMLAVVIEVGQIALADRLFGITDVLTACAGAGLGFLLVRRAGYRPYGRALGSLRSG